MEIQTVSKILSTFNFILIIVGYPIITTLFLPDLNVKADGDVTVTRLVTVPFRATVLAVSLIIIIVHWRDRWRIDTPTFLYFLFWFLLSFRMVYDLKIRTDIYIDPSVVENQFLYAYLVCLIPAIAVFRSARYIDLEWAFRGILGGYLLLVPILAINSPILFSTEDTGGRRLFGNIAMNPISLGRAGTIMILLAIFWINRTKHVWYKIAASLLILAGIFVLLRSGSRSPLFALVVCISLYLISRSKSPVFSAFLAFTIIVVFFLTKDLLFNVVENISPVMASRLSLSGNVSEFDEISNGRFTLFGAATEKFLSHPVLGDTYTIVFPDGRVSYSHNIVLDAFMGLGFFGGLMLIFILIYALWKSCQMIYQRSPHCWIGLIYICYVTIHMFSGCFYQADVLNSLLVLIFAMGRHGFSKNVRLVFS